SHLKEYVIATEVFGRDSSYDPRVDSVVRVQAGRLRSKLLEYYATEGKDDKVIIDLPKGHYTPIFSYARNITEALQNGLGEVAAAEPAVAIINGVKSSAFNPEMNQRSGKMETAAQFRNETRTPSRQIAPWFLRLWLVSVAGLILLTLILGVA